MSFLIDNQLILLLASFAAGIAGWLAVLRRPDRDRAWKFSDLIWIVVGGFGALAAVLAGLYRADTGRVERQIDLAYAATRAFDRDAARFRLSRCAAPVGPLITLCDKADYLSASTALNRDLPLFLDITRHTAPLQRLWLFGKTAQTSTMSDQADAFSTDQIIAFQARDDGTNTAIEALRASGQFDIAADYQVLAEAYDDLIRDIQELKAEWDYLRANRIFLQIQVLALCLVAFAAPFRIGKSLADLG